MITVVHTGPDTFGPGKIHIILGGDDPTELMQMLNLMQRLVGDRAWEEGSQRPTKYREGWRVFAFINMKEVK